MRTTAALKTVEGFTVVGAGRTHDLERAQRLVLQAGEIPAMLPGADAEITVLTHAISNGLTPEMLKASRAFCPFCTEAIENLGGIVIDPTTAVWMR